MKPAVTIIKGNGVV